MRTLQEKYNGIQEGKFSKEHFLVEARMQQPQLITRFNGYDDAVQILKNKGMIVEAKKEVVNEISDILRGFLKGVRSAVQHEGTEEQVNQYIDSVESNMRKPNGHEKYMGWKESDYITDFNRTLTEAKLTKKSLTDYRYKPTNDMDKYPYEQILRGIRVELEALQVLGTPTAEEYSKALAKVSKNLEKDSIFYTNQVAGVNPKVDLHDKMVPFADKVKVDTFNGMKKAALKEGFKKLIKKVLSENMGDMFGDEERAARAANYGQPTRAEYEFFSDPENYNEEEEFELHGEEDLEESAMGDIYLLAQEHDRFEHFVQAVEDEFGPVDDIAELEHIFNSTRGEDSIDYGDENFSDAEIYEGRKAKSLSQLLK